MPVPTPHDGLTASNHARIKAGAGPRCDAPFRPWDSAVPQMGKTTEPVQYWGAHAGGVHFASARRLESAEENRQALVYQYLSNSSQTALIFRSAEFVRSDAGCPCAADGFSRFAQFENGSANLSECGRPRPQELQQGLGLRIAASHRLPSRIAAPGDGPGDGRTPFGCGASRAAPYDAGDKPAMGTHNGRPQRRPTQTAIGTIKVTPRLPVAGPAASARAAAHAPTS